MALIDRDVLKSYATGGVTSVGLLTLAEIDMQPTIDPVHAAGGCYCHECVELYIENMTTGTKEPFTETGFLQARSSGDYILLHCKHVNRFRGTKDFCSRGRRREGGE